MRKSRRRQRPVRKLMQTIKKTAVAILLIITLGAVYDYCDDHTLNSAQNVYTCFKTVTENSNANPSDLLRFINGIASGSKQPYVKSGVVSLDPIPEFTGDLYITVNDNIPVFSEEEMNSDPFIYLSELDLLGRCSVAEAMLTKEQMPTGERGEIGHIRPSGWQQAKYEEILDYKPSYIYQRAHLLGWQLTGINDDPRNLITSTRRLNVLSMLPWENLIADYLRGSGKRKVLYRVTPIFSGADLVASGVQMEARSIGDDSICFNVYAPNSQEGVHIDYATGYTWAE